jgi:hypothetical protein
MPEGSLFDIFEHVRIKGTGELGQVLSIAQVPESNFCEIRLKGNPRTFKPEDLESVEHLQAGRC